MRVLVIRCGRLGDSVLTFPAISALSELYPQSEIVVLTEARTASLFSLHKSVSEVIVLPCLFYRKPKLGEYLSIAKLMWRLRERGFDYVFDFQDASWCTAIISRFVARKKAIGFKNFKKGLFYHAGPYGKTDDNAGTIESMALSYFRIATSLEKLEDNRLFERVRKIELALKNSVPAKERYLFFHLGANETHKTWPQERFLELAEILRERISDLKIVFSLNANEIDVFNSIFRERKMTNCVAWTTDSVVTLASKIRESTLFVSTDTGPSHLASILNVPRIILCQPFVNEAIWYGGYSRERCIYISAKREKCEKCNHFPSCKQKSCMENIQAKDVAEKIIYLLKNLK